MVYFVKILIDDEVPQGATEYEVAKPDSEKDDETKTHRITVADLGMKPFKVEAGTKITLMIRNNSSDYEIRRCYYGREGNPENYKALDQDQVFEVESSEHNQNGTSSNWGQMPYILYSK